MAVPVVEALRTLEDEEAGAVDVDGAGLSGAAVDADAGALAFFLAMLEGAQRTQHGLRRAADQLARSDWTCIRCHASGAREAATV